VTGSNASPDQILSRLARAAFDPLGWVETAASGPYVGVVGFDVPTEILVAAGLHPVQLRGAPIAATVADFDGLGLDPVAASHVASFVRGDYAALDYLVISHDRSMNAKLFYVLRELARLGELPQRPRLAFVDLRHMPRPATSAYNRRRVHQFAELVGRWCGGTLTDVDLQRAIDETNLTRRLLRSFEAARRSPEAPFRSTDALAVLGAAQVMEPAEFRRAVVSLLDGVGGRPERGPRLYVSGSTPEDPRPYQALDSLGAVVVSEDHDLGLRRRAEPIEPGDDPLGALASAYGTPPPVAGWEPLGARARHAVDAARAAGATVVLEVRYLHDRALGWEWPSMRRELLRGGIDGRSWQIPWPEAPEVPEPIASLIAGGDAQMSPR